MRLASPKATVWSPFYIVEGLKLEHPLVRVHIKADVRRDRKINLLEWAVLAPLVKISPTPSISEISEKLGMGEKAFLQEAAHQLDSIGAVRYMGQEQCWTTEKGRAMFEKGRILGDPREVEDDILYDPATKEWYIGSKLSDENTTNKEEWVGGIPEPPAALVVEHLKRVNVLKKGEQVFDTTISSCEMIHLKVGAEIVLIPDRVFMRSDGMPLGENNRKEFDKALLKGSRESGALNQLSSNLRQAADQRLNWRPTRSIDIPSDCHLRHAGKTDLVDYLKGEKWCILSKESWKVLREGKLPRIVFLLSHDRSDAEAARRWGIQVHCLHLPSCGDIDLITKDKVVSTISIQDEDLNIPAYAEQGSEAAEAIRRAAADIITELPVMGKGLAFALLAIEPGEEGIEKCLGVIGASSPSEREIEDVIQYLSNWEGKRSCAAMSDAEANIWAWYMQMASWDKLMDLPTSIVRKNLGPYLMALEGKRPDNLEAPNTHMDSQIKALEDMKGLFSDSPFHDNYLRFVSSLRLNSIRGLMSGRGISWGPKVIEHLSSIQNQEQKKMLSTEVCKYIGKLPLGEKEAREGLKLCQKMHELGAEVDRETLISIVNQIFEGPVSMLDHRTRQVLESVANTLSSTDAKVDLGSMAILPEKMPKPLNDKELMFLLNNLEGIFDSRIVSGATITGHLKDISDALSKGDTPDMNLWLSFLARVRNGPLQDIFTIPDDEVISSISASGSIPEKFQKSLREIGIVWEVSDSKGAGTSGQGRKRVVVDGSNVSRYGSDDGAVSVDKLIRAYEALLGKYHLEEVYIIIGVGVQGTLNRDKKGQKDLDKLKNYFSNERSKFLILAPSGQNDDEHIIQTALDQDMWILSNDRYRDHFSRDPELQEQVEPLLLKYTFVGDGITIPQLAVFQGNGGKE